MGKFCDFISEKGRLQSTSEIYEKIRYNGKNGLYHRTAPCIIFRNISVRF